VLVLGFKAGFHRLIPVLEQHGFAPDVLVQRELLGERIFFPDIAYIDCIRAFWAVDTHLNMYWQKHYAKLFDVILTPHVSLFGSLDASERPAAIARMPWPAYDRACKPYNARKHLINFVGRMDAHRPLRGNLRDLMLEHFSLKFKDGFNHSAMLDLYEDTCFLPNESIAFEVNFRLLEGASAGCCMFTPDIGEDQNTQLEPGKECIIYSDGLELLDLLKFFQKRLPLAEKIGQAAWCRVQAEHLPIHRAAIYSDLVFAKRAGAVGYAAKEALWLALCEVLRHDGQPTILEQTTALLPPDPQDSAPVLAKRLQIYAENKKYDLASGIINRIMASTPKPEYYIMDLSGFGAAMLMNDLDASCAFVRRIYAAQRRTLPCDPETFAQCCLLLLDVLLEKNMYFDLGFDYRPGEHCPFTAMQMFERALFFGADQAQCADKIRLSSVISHYLPHKHLDMCAMRVNIDADNWLARQQLGLAYLRCFRVDNGLLELKQALDYATKQGMKKEFSDCLNAARAGHVAVALEKL
jgi:hypothetical protein